MPYFWYSIQFIKFTLTQDFKFEYKQSEIILNLMTLMGNPFRDFRAEFQNQIK